MIEFAGLHGPHEGRNLGGTFMSALEDMGLVDKVRTHVLNPILALIPNQPVSDTHCR